MLSILLQIDSGFNMYCERPPYKGQHTGDIFSALWSLLLDFLRPSVNIGVHMSSSLISENNPGKRSEDKGVATKKRNNGCWSDSNWSLLYESNKHDATNEKCPKYI